METFGAALVAYAAFKPPTYKRAVQLCKKPI
jgi:hypothetical protein